MKKYILFLLTLGLAVLQSCDLDINENPNSPTAKLVTPEYVLPGAITSTASNIVSYNSYGAFLVGYQLPGHGISGYGSTYTYNFTSTDNTALWNNVFANLRDYEYVIKEAETDSKYLLFASVARILKAFNYQLLIDAYGDVSWTEGLQGKANLTPAFDDDAAVYEALVKEIDLAIKGINDNREAIGILLIQEYSDPLFGGNLDKWKQFANNVKLRLLVRAEGSSIDSFVKTAFGTFSDDGFLLENALVDPGYNASGSQNPFWNTFHSSISGTITTPANYYIPSKYVLTFYNGGVLQDDIRGALIYKGFPTVVTGQLGDETNNPDSPDYSWTGTNVVDGRDNARIGLFKSRTQSQPIFLLSEVHFLLAEAALNNHVLKGDAKTNFEAGIKASFEYLSTKASGSYIEDEDEDGNLVRRHNPERDFKAYVEENAGKYLADYDAATTDEQRLEAIITQKYIALNYIHGHEAWNEFRRTAYPKISGTSATATFVSISSQSNRSDKLPVRQIYPQAEYNLNPNVPKIANAFSNPVFWDAD
ncbi:MAG TPA: SusD/RagB family nutrient-binding outer membrane lipoprotein [Porphyromonadaceae bacterium]|jgi:hypothetical protein|nr:SusD/RagB family nutrient-binding outer membrane lipoprotein [Porphyromonadaceae bacterium]